MFKRLAMLALLGILVLSAKTFKTHLTVQDQEMAGNAQLKPGEYSLQVDGSAVLFIDRQGKQIDAGAKVETADHKFPHTAVATSNADGTKRIISIELAGSPYRVVFP